MSIREQISNFKFFEVVAPHLADLSVTPIIGATVDTQGYETCAFTIQHSAIGSGAGGVILTSFADPINVYMEHASNSTTGVDDVGAWSYVSAEHVCGVDIYQLMSDLTIDSWLALDNITRTAYKISVPARAGGLSGLVLAIALSTTSAASCLTNSYQAKIGYLGPKRWVRIMMSASTDISIVAVAAHAFLGLPANWPVNPV